MATVIAAVPASNSQSVTSSTAPLMATASAARPSSIWPVPTWMMFGFSLCWKVMRWKAPGAMNSAVATAEAMSVTKYVVSWNVVTCWKRCWNGTVSRNPKSTCTPGIATRSSCSSSMSWRLRRSCSSSLRSSRGRSPSSVAMSGRDSPSGRTLRGALLARARDAAQPGDRLADDARDLHLRDADALADLGLREVVLEAQPQHLALARRDRPQELGQRRAVLGQAEALLGPADRVAERVSGLVLAAARRLQRGRPVGARGLERLEHLLLGGPRRLGDLGDGGLAAQVGGQLADLLVHAQCELLEVARHPHRPRAVAEVALDLAEDRGHRVAGEGHLAVEIEAVDGLHQPQAGHLEEVVEGLVGALVAAGELAGERQEALDED